MKDREILDIEKFKFRGLHPDVFIGTASDRYAGWIGQIYSAERYGDRITRRMISMLREPMMMGRPTLMFTLRSPRLRMRATPVP